MILSYGITQRGIYHIKNDTKCQDSHRICKVSDRVAVAVVADGLGSEEHSDVASRIAADEIASYCASRLDTEDDLDDEQKILETLRNSFSIAQDEIEAIAEDRGHNLDQYDTTASVAIMIDDTLYCGQSGDSGIVALTCSGTYERVTDQQRDDYGRVYPLFFKDKWEFFKYEKPVSSVLLATDGIYGLLFPSLLAGEKVSIHVNLARFFMDPEVLRIHQDGESLTETRIDAFLEGISEDKCNDDKTLVVLVNTEALSEKQPDEYYQEPDWLELKKKKEEEWMRKAYPHLYPADGITDVSSTDTPLDKSSSES